MFVHAGIGRGMIVIVAEAAVLHFNLLQQLNEFALQACQHEDRVHGRDERRE